MTPVVKGSD